MNLEQAARQALEALEGCYITFYEDEDIPEAITALREALAQQQEPVAGSPSWEAFDIAIEAERERCVKVCKEWFTPGIASEIAAAIRGTK